MFTNTDFTHFDIPPLADDAQFNFDLNEPKNNPSVKYEDLLSGSEPIQGFHPHGIPSSTAESTQFFGSYNTPIQPAPTPGYGNLENRSSPTSTTAGGHPARPQTEATDNLSLNTEERSRVAAEEDKRRRNTAASARFRIKKKQREQALESTVREAQDKSSKLEARVNQLEMENKWLKDLITEKNGMQSKEEMAAAYQQYRKDSEERDLKASEHTTGVGTN